MLCILLRSTFLFILNVYIYIRSWSQARPNIDKHVHLCTHVEVVVMLRVKINSPKRAHYLHNWSVTHAQNAFSRSSLSFTEYICILSEHMCTHSTGYSPTQSPVVRLPNIPWSQSGSDSALTVVYQLQTEDHLVLETSCALYNHNLTYDYFVLLCVSLKVNSCQHI